MPHVYVSLTSVRNPVIDVAKGYGILLVLLGHTVYYDSSLFRVIFNFHMPLFVFLSGMTYSPDKFSDFKACLKNLWSTLGIPFVFFTLLGAVICAFTGRIIQHSLMDWLRMAASFVHGDPCVGGSLWFLSCLAVVKFTFWTWHKRHGGLMWKILVAVLAFACGVLLGEYANKKVALGAPLMLFSVPMAFFFFMAGHASKGLMSRLKDIAKPLLLVIAVLLMVVEVVIAIRFPTPNMAIPEFPSPWTFLPASLLGIAAVVCLSSMPFRILVFIGKNSLYYFLFERWARELWFAIADFVCPDFMGRGGELNPNLLSLSPLQTAVSVAVVFALSTLALPFLRAAVSWARNRWSFRQH